MTTTGDQMRRGDAVFFDHEADIQLMLQHVLPRLGWGALPARSGEEALALIQAPPVPLDCFLLDVSRIHWSGLALGAAAAARAPHLPIILMSSADQIALPTELVESVVGVLWKPFTIAELEQQLQVALARRPADGPGGSQLWYQRSRLLTLPARIARRTAEV